MVEELVIYHAHTACSRVTLAALEQVGAPYQDRLLDLRAAEHRKPDYLAVSPQGKVPCLVADGASLTENAAILRWLHSAFPDAGLFPEASDPWDEAKQLSVLHWIASGWHPTVRAVKVPFMWTTGAPEPVRARGEEALSAYLDQIDAVLAERKFWFGETWSIVDTYFWWAYTNSEFGGFDLASWSHVTRHRADNEAWPALQRALAREAAAVTAQEAIKKR